MYKIGLQNIQYPEIRNIVDKIQDARYYKYVEKQSSLERIINKIMGLLKLKKRTIKKRYSYEDVFKPKYDKNLDFFHLFNSVSSGKNDWGVTFETVVPLFEEKKLGVFLKGQILIFDNEKDIKKVNKPECKFLIAISECTYNLQIEYLNYFPIYKDNILRKMYVLHPPQKILMEIYEKPSIEDVVNFMFVGKEFLSKGGIEILNVFNHIKDTYPNFTLTLIGSLEKNQNSRCFVNDVELIELKNVIKYNEKRITYYESLPNDQLMKLMLEKIHVGMLPTHADTYGYSLLEFQSAGCPVISTNCRALSEINNEECGWLIDVPQSNLGEPYANTESELIFIQKTIEEQLCKIMVEILNNPNSIANKGMNSIKRIKENHDLGEFSKKLSNIYSNI